MSALSKSAPPVRRVILAGKIGPAFDGVAISYPSAPTGVEGVEFPMTNWNLKSNDVAAVRFARTYALDAAMGMLD